MELSKIDERIDSINNEILRLQDIAIEADIPNVAHPLYAKKCWHSPEKVQAAKNSIIKLNGELNKLFDKKRLAKASS